MKNVLFLLLAFIIATACNNQNPAESEAHKQMMADLQKIMLP